ncbi:hypothetical protein K6119_17395 [Paracrocinitomix mangrovi]|uniref:hypothetical protein n=1 Tax=Paracrocinitomix mangrovi TaxID=2862509 RepID=UPI001C8D1716|nr:hypothetical protein [Paracrocinitomix mangrovi]UKN01502.1 hypothetical protein K6119_17395 [Paracrocinitomix mangrovi]
MKTLLTTLVFLTLWNVNAQTLNNEQFIVEYLGQTHFSELQNSNPSYLKFLDVRCSDGFKILDFVDEKMSDFSVINEIRVITDGDKSQKQMVTAQQLVDDYADGSFNFIKYQLQYDRSEITYYVLGSTGKVIMIYPTEYINKIQAEK